MGVFKLCEAAIRQAVTVNGIALERAPANLEDDAEMVLAAVAKDFRSLMFASSKLKMSEDFMLRAIKINSKSISYGPLMVPGPSGSDPVMNMNFLTRAMAINHDCFESVMLLNQPSKRS